MRILIRSPVMSAKRKGGGAHRAIENPPADVDAEESHLVHKPLKLQVNLPERWGGNSVEKKNQRPGGGFQASTVSKPIDLRARNQR